jgi:phosphohistidine phosphatase SixA
MPANSNKSVLLAMAVLLFATSSPASSDNHSSDSGATAPEPERAFRPVGEGDSVVPHGNALKIFIMRHAERFEDTSSLPHLTPKGYERAHMLVPFICEKYGKPDFIIAASLYKKNNRPFETVQPLATAIHVPIDDSYEAIRNTELANALLHNPKYAGKFVLIVWHHSLMPELARALGAPRGTYPDPWKGDVYNLILSIERHEGSAPKVDLITEPF